MDTSLYITVVFMGFLYAAAWQDHRDGSVNLAMLLISALVTLVWQMASAGVAGAAAGERIAYALAVLALAGALVRRQKLGGADMILFTQITFLFGIVPFVLILALASVTALAAAGVKCLASPDRTTLRAFGKQEIRFIPHIALAATAVLLAGMHTG